MKKESPDFTDETLERMLIKLSLTSKKWLQKTAVAYDQRWPFTNPNVKVIFSLLASYYNKRGDIVAPDILKALIDKYAEVHPDERFDKEKAKEIVTDVGLEKSWNTTDDIIVQNADSFIQRNGWFALTSRCADNVTRNTKEALYDYMEKFKDIMKLQYMNSDLGMNYFNEADFEEHWKRNMTPDAKIPFGWAGLDDLTNGGMLRDGKQLILLMAQAGLGKSVFMSNMAVNFLKAGLSVVVISLEMSKDVYANRFDAHISGCNINRLAQDAETAMSKIKEFWHEHPESKLYIQEYPPRSICSNDIQAYLESLKAAGHHFDVVIVDYLNLVLPNRRSDSMYKEGLSASEELRALSYVFNVPFISAVQANTAGMNSDTIDMENVSESRGIVHTCDFLAALYQGDDDRDDGRIRMRILKNRLGGNVHSQVIFKIDPETLRLDDITGSSGAGTDLALTSIDDAIGDL